MRVLRWPAQLAPGYRRVPEAQLTDWWWAIRHITAALPSGPANTPVDSNASATVTWAREAWQFLLELQEHIARGLHDPTGWPKVEALREADDLAAVLRRAMERVQDQLGAAKHRLLDQPLQLEPVPGLPNVRAALCDPGQDADSALLYLAAVIRRLIRTLEHKGRPDELRRIVETVVLTEVIR